MNLESNVSDIHRIRLSRIAAATSQSKAYLTAADKITARFESSNICSPIFEEMMESFKTFVAEKDKRIKGLEREHQAVTEEMLKLQREAQEINPMPEIKCKDPVGEDVDLNGVEFLEYAQKMIGGVNAKWVGRMERTESVGPVPRDVLRLG